MDSEPSPIKERHMMTPEERKKFRDEIFAAEEEFGFRVTPEPKGVTKIDEIPPSPEGDGETYNTQEAGPKGA
jgi:hypothetical protein